MEPTCTDVSERALNAWTHTLTASLRRAVRSEDTFLRRRFITDAAIAVGTLRLMTRAHDGPDADYDGRILNAIERSGVSQHPDAWREVSAALRNRDVIDAAAHRACDVTRLVILGRLTGTTATLTPRDAGSCLVAVDALCAALEGVLDM